MAGLVWITSWTKLIWSDLEEVGGSKDLKCAGVLIRKLNVEEYQYENTRKPKIWKNQNRDNTITKISKDK